MCSVSTVFFVCSCGRGSQHEGFSRTILFVKGKPVASDSSEEMKSTKKGDLTTVNFGGKNEVDEVRDAFLIGD